MKPLFAALIVILVMLAYFIIIPAVNNRQLNKMSLAQQVRVVKKRANKLAYFTNISSGTSGTLFYVKNKRKILLYPWTLADGKMLCSRDDIYTLWDHPDDRPEMTAEEIQQAKDELEKYNSRNPVKLYIVNK